MKLKEPVILLAVLIVFTAHSCMQTSKVPDELTGVWKTTDSEYTGTFLELTADKIIIGKKGKKNTSFPSTSTRWTAKPSGGRIDRRSSGPRK